MSISAENSIIKLSDRLTAIAQMVRDNSRVADVGCDHGKLSAWLILSGKCTYIYAIDNSKPSLQKATDLFARHNITSMTKPIYANGLSAILPASVDDIVIAGLGSDTTKEIISEAVWLKDPQKHLILDVHSHHDRMRRYIYSEGYEILQEKPIYEKGHCYSIMSLSYCDKQEDIPYIFSELGKIELKDIDSKRYIQQVYMRAKKVPSKMIKAKVYDEKKLQEIVELREYIKTEYMEVVEGW